ncbi:MAG TPA: TRAP transporter substrate-binding protein DctP [Burkholderiales bacterium]|jgi:TRAP-type C4-dicarboxylate transport system substrate-binding protein
MRKIRWVLAHEPIELFLRAAKRFTQEVNGRAAGELDIECMTLCEYAERYNGGNKVTKHDLLDLMESGAIEMSQMYTTWLGERYSSDLRVLDLPFLFRDHDHAAAVLDGEIGAGLLAGLEKSGVKGLAFTYSGGFRMIPAVKAINRVADFDGLRIRSNRSPVAVDTLKALGAEPVVMELEDISAAVQSGDIVGGESTYPRFYGLKQNEVCDFINDTGHSLFLTSIITSHQFWDSLEPRLQAIIRSAAANAARFERVESVEDIALVQQRCHDEGIAVIKLPAEELAKFKAATACVYEKYESQFGGLVVRIQQTH